jgi:hypothetical protein
MIITDGEIGNLSPKTKKEIIEEALKKPKLGVVISPSKRETINVNSSIDNSDYQYQNNLLTV